MRRRRSYFSHQEVFYRGVITVVYWLVTMFSHLSIGGDAHTEAMLSLRAAASGPQFACVHIHALRPRLEVPLAVFVQGRQMFRKARGTFVVHPRTLNPHRILAHNRTHATVHLHILEKRSHSTPGTRVATTQSSKTCNREAFLRLICSVKVGTLYFRSTALSRYSL